MPWLSPMAGAGLAGLGALAGGFNEQLNKNQQLRRQQLLDQMALEEFRWKQRQEAQQLAAMSGAGGMLNQFLAGSQQPLAPVAGGGPMPSGPDTMAPSFLMSPTMPGTNLGVGGGAFATGTPSSLSGTDAGGGLRAGGALSGRTAELAQAGLNDPDLLLTEKYESGGRNIPQGIVPPGGGYNPSVGRVTGPSTAGGNLQITNTTWRDWAPKAGVNLAQYPNAMSAPRAVQFAVGEEGKLERGTQPWDQFNAKLRAARAAGEAQNFTAQMTQAGGNPQQAQAGANIVNTQIPPQWRGGMDPLKMWAGIQKAMPNADLATQFMAFDKVSHVLDPIYKQQWDEHKTDLLEWDKAQDRGLEERRIRIQEQGTPELVETPQGPALFNPRSNQSRPANLPPGTRKFGEVPKASKNVEITDAEGKTIFRGAAHETAGGWIDDATGSAIQVPAGGSIKLSGQQGRQLAQVTQRLEIGANEVAKAVTSMAKLPVTTTLGMFGGAQAQMGPDLGENMKKALANEATPQSAQILKALSNGVSRGLAILESGGSAQGLVGLSKQLENDLPQAGDTGLTIAAKYADIRQIVEAATEVLQANPDITDKQLKLLQNISEAVQKAVPYTTADVALLASDPSEENVAQFAQRVGLGGGSTEQPTTGKTSSGIQWQIVPGP